MSNNATFAKRPSEVSVDGRALYLTGDLEQLEGQLKGEVLKADPDRKLIDNISTDELTPGWVCFWYDETLGNYCLVGLRGGKIEKDSIKNSGAKIIVSGLSKGCGSSRETAPFSEKSAGIQVVVAKTIEKIYGQNCRNIGLLTTTDFGILEKLERGESVPLSAFTDGLDPIAKGIVEYGGLFNYNKARLAGEVAPPASSTEPRPMNLTEKIIASRAVKDATTGELGIDAVKPGDALFCRSDVRFSHDYTTAMGEALFKNGFGKDAKVNDPASAFAFRDHLTFLKNVMSEEQKKKGLLQLADNLATVQTNFVNEQGIRLFGEVEGGGSEAICHNAVMEELGGPGQLVVGTDSHTCTAGALGCFAFGVGTTDMANAWFTKDIQVKVPESVKYVLNGKPRDDVTAKDIILFIMAEEYIKSGKAIGKVLEFSGEGLSHLNMDERATLTNMAVEAGATTGIIEPDEVTAQYLMNFRGWGENKAREGFLKGDKDAAYDAEFAIDLTQVEPMIATPGDPRNGVTASELQEKEGTVKIHIAYGGSCTGGKMADMDMYAEVLQKGLDKGLKVVDDVDLFIQFGSQRIKQYAVDKGYLEVFEKAGAQLIEPSCGACIKAGPGVSNNKDQVSVSAINRNFPGRSGPGNVYLTSPRVVASSALKGCIITPEALFAS
ncbi:MAG: 3-isopropylmalate dehydratase [Deltaproteobacteria bacterium]|nr:3-isopropylmalate dehydratase [Deltaproteobacteria bacterium]